MTQKKQVSGKDLFDFDEPMPAGHWAVPWSDLMMVAFVLFAVLYSYVLSHRDIGEALAKPQKNIPSRTSVGTFPKFPHVPPPFTEAASKPDPLGNAEMEELYETLTRTVRVKNPDDVTVALSQDKTVRISVGEPMLFDPGRADLKPESIDFLEEFAEKIRKTRYKVVVEGHTDSFPIHSDYFPTNWELSAIRAIRVIRFLTEYAGLEPERFSVAGYSLYKPLAPNTSPANKARNRRVEIVITREKIQ